jgi:hypothetical protein
MFSHRHVSHTRRPRRGPSPVLLLAVGSILLACLAGGRSTTVPASRATLPAAVDFDGRDPRYPDSKRPKVQVSFPRESYRPGSSAPLVFASTAKRVTVQFYRAGTESGPTNANDLMLGTPVSRTRALGRVWFHRVVQLHLGNWPSGVYFARLTAPGKRVGFAPFIVRPRTLGAHRIAVVMPTQTWQAYNFRDEDGDGVGDTWYADWNRHTARLGRPFLDRGEPPHFKYYDEPFLRWLVATGKQVDYLSDADLNRVRSGRQLARAYALIVFPGHHEYVTTNEYNAVTGFRNRGGNLMFLSADDFFWRVTRHRGVMTKTNEWRELGRPEARLIGVEYRANDRGQHRAPWIVRNVAATPWLFAGTGLHNGSRFGGNAGIEIDEMAPSSPRGTKLVAEIPNLFRRGLSADMTYYETRSGAKVFAAGAFTLAGAVWDPPVGRMVGNLWHRLASDEDTGIAKAR